MIYIYVQFKSVFAIQMTNNTFNKQDLKTFNNLEIKKEKNKKKEDYRYNITGRA